MAFMIPTSLGLSDEIHRCIETTEGDRFLEIGLRCLFAKIRVNECNGDVSSIEKL